MSIFVGKIAIVNSLAMTKIFYIIGKVLLLFLFISGCCDRDFLKLILTYFKIVKINNYSIFYLYCLV